MKQKLSKREMILICIAGIFAFGFFLFHFVVGPVMRYYSERTDEYERLYLEKQVVDYKLETEAAAIAAYENAGKTFDEISEIYPMVMPNEEVDKILTGLCLSNNLCPTMLGMSEAAEIRYEIKSEGGGQSEDGAQESEGTEGQQSDQGSAAFVIVSANMNLRGSYVELKNLINTINNTQYIRIGQFSFTNPADAGRSGSSNISAYFEVSMLKERT